MATKRAMNEALKRLATWYGDQIPPTVLADELHIPLEEAQAILDEQKIVKPKRTYTRKKKAEPVKESIVKKETDLVIYLLPIGALLIALVTLTRSVLFTYNFFLRTDNMLSAILMSTAFGLVGYFAPVISIYSVRSRQWFISLFTVIAFGLITWFNIYITTQELSFIKGQKEALVTNSQEEVINARRRVPDIDTEISRLEVSIERQTEEYDVILEKSKVDGLPSWEYNRHRNNLADTKTLIEANEAKIKELQEERRVLTNLPGYYTLTEVTEGAKVEARKMDTWYAFTLETIGPLFMAVAAFLRKKE